MRYRQSDCFSKAEIYLLLFRSCSIGIVLLLFFVSLAWSFGFLQVLLRTLQAFAYVKNGSHKVSVGFVDNDNNDNLALRPWYKRFLVLDQ